MIIYCFCPINALFLCALKSLKSLFLNFLAMKFPFLLVLFWCLNVCVLRGQVHYEITATPYDGCGTYSDCRLGSSTPSQCTNTQHEYAADFIKITNATVVGNRLTIDFRGCNGQAFSSSEGIGIRTSACLCVTDNIDPDGQNTNIGNNNHQIYGILPSDFTSGTRTYYVVLKIGTNHYQTAGVTVRASNLAAPTILAQTGASIGAIDVRWNRVANATKYVLYKKTGNNIWVKLKTYPAITADTTVTVNGYVAGAETCFRMKAGNDAGDWSQPSNESCTKAGVLTVNPGSVKVSHLADSMRIDVTSGYTWTASRPASATWLTLTKESIPNTQNGKIKLVFAANELIPATSRACDVTISATVNGVVVRRIVKVFQDTFRLKPPVISPPNGSIFFNDTTVSITAEPNTTIFYTTDSSQPTVNSRRYTGSFRIDTTTLVKAIAVKFAAPPIAANRVMVAQNNFFGDWWSSTTSESENKKDIGAPILIEPAIFTTYFDVPAKLKFRWNTNGAPVGTKYVLRVRRYRDGVNKGLIVNNRVTQNNEEILLEYNAANNSINQTTVADATVQEGDYFLWNVTDFGQNVDNEDITIEPTSDISYQDIFKGKPISEAFRFDVGTILSPVYGDVFQDVTSSKQGTPTKWYFWQRGHTTAVGGDLTNDAKAWDANLLGPDKDKEYDEGMPVYPVAEGTVEQWDTKDPTYINKTYGQVLLKHTLNGSSIEWYSGYLHMNPISITHPIDAEAQLKINTRIGLVASRGCYSAPVSHLHFAVYQKRLNKYQSLDKKIFPRFVEYNKKKLELRIPESLIAVPPGFISISPGSSNDEEAPKVKLGEFTWQPPILPSVWMHHEPLTIATKHRLYIFPSKNKWTLYTNPKCPKKQYRINLISNGYSTIDAGNSNNNFTLTETDFVVSKLKIKTLYSWRIRTQYFNGIDGLSEIRYFKWDGGEVGPKRSELSDAHIQIKLGDRWIDYGKTDEAGMKEVVFFKGMSDRDSMQISAAGSNPLRFTLDSSFLLGEPMLVPMIKSSDYEHRLELIEPKVVQTEPSVISRYATKLFKISAQNLIKVEYTKSDTLWHTLTLSDGVATVGLDTGGNILRFRLISQIDTFESVKNVYYYPIGFTDTSDTGEAFEFIDTLYLNINSKASRCKFYMDGDYMGELTSGDHVIELPRGKHDFKFMKTGYITQRESEQFLDTLMVDLQPLDFRSDSNDYDCQAARIVYRNGITVQSNGGKYRIVKSSEDYSAQGLQSLSYTTTIRRLLPTSDTLKLHSILNQPIKRFNDSIYVLQIQDGRFRKHTRLSDSVEYDSTIQKLGHYKLTGQTEGLVLMQRLAPVRETGYQRVSVHQSEGVKLAWHQLFRDPDSIKGDMSYEAISDSNFVMQVQGDSLYLRHRSCNTGRFTFRCRAKHDELSRTEAFEIEVRPLRVSATPEPARCFGTATGRIATQLSSPTPLYQYQWSNGTRLANAENLRSGAYTVVVRDPNGCADSAQVTVTQPPVLTIQTVVTPIACHESNGNSASGSIAVRSTGGINANHRYQWSNNAGNITELRGLSAGIYTVTVRDDNQCIQQRSDTLRQPAALQNRFDNPAPENCDGQNGQVTAIVNGGAFPYTYRWQNNETGERAFRLAQGNNIVTITDGNGCTKVDTVAIAFVQTLRADTVIGSRLKCFGDLNGWGTIRISGARNVSYSWNTGARTDSVTNVPAGIYTVTVSTPLCRLTRQVTVAQPNRLQVDSFRTSSLPCTQR